ncbi:uncharacterized protein A4U43_C10F15950 [Asparagus officinalis]|uniref:Uncharacterized protein n=1 Tax=Asparagus officinalis TaxID=4686 RepID=A0A5P1E3B5_ASPOF|nr:uncharacterized protein A4U43_C10F15950 [Asparagus officinalis]
MAKAVMEVETSFVAQRGMASGCIHIDGESLTMGGDGRLEGLRGLMEREGWPLEVADHLGPQDGKEVAATLARGFG